MLNNNHIDSKANTTTQNTSLIQSKGENHGSDPKLLQDDAVGIILATAFVIGAIAQLLKVLVPVMIDKNK